MNMSIIYLIIKIPRHVRELQARHEHIGLEPPYEQLLGRRLVVAVPADHVGQHQRVPVHVHLEKGRDERREAVLECPVRVLVDHAHEDW